MNGTVPNPHYPALFSPVSLGGHTLRNRIIHASIVTKYVVNHAPTEALLNYYRSRAAGGAAAIITEPVAMTAHNADAERLSRPRSARYLPCRTRSILGSRSRIAFAARIHSNLP